MCTEARAWGAKRRRRHLHPKPAGAPRRPGRLSPNQGIKLQAPKAANAASPAANAPAVRKPAAAQAAPAKPAKPAAVEDGWVTVGKGGKTGKGPDQGSAQSSYAARHDVVSIAPCPA